MLDAVTEYVLSLSPAWFYLVLFLSSFVENIFPPLPGDTVTVFAGYVVGRSQQGYPGVLLATTAGGMAGFMVFYILGRRIPEEYFLHRHTRLFPASSFIKAGAWFQRYGYWVLLANRFFSVIRTVISIVAGLYRLPWYRVLLTAGLGCLIWNSLLIWAGYTLGANWRRVETILSRYNMVLLTLALVLVAAWFLRHRLRARRARR